MLEELKNLVRQYAGDSIINNPAIPNHRNDEAVEDASQSIINGLQKEAANGDPQNVVNLFNGGGNAALNSPVTQNIQSGFVENLMNKFGLDHGKASSIAGSLIPTVLQKFIHKTNDPNDNSFDLKNVLGNLTGGGGIGGILGKLL
jgi:hypothetical protein